MTAWDRVQSMQLELAQAHARIRGLEAELWETRNALMAQRENVDALSDEIETLRMRHVADVESRDLARRVAMRLEEENHALAGGVCALCSQVLVPVPMLGEAR